MYDCYNEAYNYLKEKYGYKRTFLTTTFHYKTRNYNKKEKGEAIAKATDKDYVLIINPIGEEDRIIEILMNQYYCSIKAKKELYYKLIQIGVIKL
jgi:hypothetical protein